MKMKIVALALLASISFARAQTQGTYTLKDAALPQQTLLMLIYSNAGKSAPASVSSDAFGNPLSGVAGTTNPNGTGLFVQGLTNGLPISTIFAAPQHIICDSGCGGGGGGGGLSVPFAGPIGTNGTPVGFKDASGNLQPLLGDTTFGQWVSIKASATIPISGSVSITGGISSINNITGTVSLPTLASTSTIQTNGSQKTQIVDGSGNVIASTSNNLNVICANCSGSGVSAVDTATYTYATSLFAGGGGFYQATSTNNALTNLQQGMFQVTAQRALFTNLRNSSGVEVGTPSTPVQVSLANTGGNAAAITVTGSGGTFPVTGTVTANAGTNLNTSLLALESGGNLALTASEIGALGSASCSTDSGTCNINALVQRNNQRLTSIVTTLGSPFQVGSSIGNTSFGISGTLPAFAATPTFNLGTLNGAATAANQATNAATTAHTCAITGFSELGCLGQIDDDIKGSIAAGTNTIGGVLQAGTWLVGLNAGSSAIGSITNTSFGATQATASALNATVVGTGTFAAQVTGTVTATQATGSNLHMVCDSGCSSSTSPTFGATFPTTGTPIGFSQGGNFVAMTGTSGNLNVNVSNTVPVTLTSTTITGTVAATQSGTWNIGTITTLPALVAGSAIVGKFGIDQTTPGTTNLVSIGTNGTVGPTTAATWGINTLGSTTSGQSGQIALGAVTTGAPSYTTAQSNALSLTLAGALRVDSSAVTQPVSLTSTTITGSVAATLNATPSLANGNGVVPTQGGSVLSATNGMYSNLLQGNAALSATNGLYANQLQANAVISTTNPSFSSITDGTNKAAVKAASTAPAAADPALVTTISPNSPNAPFAAYSTSSITRSANTTTYTANTGWNNGTPAFFSFTAACRVNGSQVAIPRIDIWSSANPTLKLAGVLWLFSGVPGTNISDDASFTIASADFANLTGSFAGVPFTLANNQATGASNSGTTIAGTTYPAQCASGSTTITGMVEVSNAYVPASGEVLHVGLATAGLN